MRTELLKDKQLADVVLCRQTIGTILGRPGYSLKQVQKTRPQKIPETDAIFANVQKQLPLAAEQPDTLRISLDTKAKVRISESS